MYIAKLQASTNELTNVGGIQISMSRVRSTLHNHLHVVVLVCVLIAVMTYPIGALLLEANVSWVPARDADIWMKFWDAWYGKSLIAGQADFYFTDLLFYPLGLSLNYHNFNVPHMLVFGALQLIMPASSAYCIAYMLVILFSALSGYVYFLYLLQDKWLASLGAVVFGFSQHVIGHAHQPDIALVATLPLSLYFFHRGTVEQRWKYVVLSGTLIGLTVFVSTYIFVCVLFTMGLYILYFSISRWRDPNHWLRLLLLLFLVGSISIVRIYPMINDAQALDNALDKTAAEDTGNDLLAYFFNYRHPILSPVFHSVFEVTPVAQTSFNSTSVNGWRHTSYLGYVPLVLIGLGILRADYRRKMTPWLLLILPFLFLRLGSALRVNDQIFTNIILPKHYLDEILPGIFRAFHETDHFQIGVLLPLAVLSCYGLMAMLGSASSNAGSGSFYL